MGSGRIDDCLTALQTGIALAHEHKLTDSNLVQLLNLNHIDTQHSPLRVCGYMALVVPKSDSVHALSTLLNTVDLVLHSMKFMNGNLICSIVGRFLTWERLGVCKARALRLQKHMGRL